VRATDKIDSLNGWNADSVVLSAAEAASFLLNALPREARVHLDSLTVKLGDGRVALTARLETAVIPRDKLGPLAGALAPWEPVAAEGPIVTTRPGIVEWRVDGLTLRGFTLSGQASRDLVTQALPGVKNGTLVLPLPRGVTGLRVRASGATLYRETAR
jgi:hypothetical protein